MATIKSFTDLSQSKTLSTILPLESADCFWDYDDLQKYHRINWFEDGYNKDSQLRLNKNNVCAWSLAALIGILPRYIEICGYTTFLDIYKTEHLGWVIEYSNNKEDFVEICFDNHNLIDACYEMIIHLHKLNLL